MIARKAVETIEFDKVGSYLKSHNLPTEDIKEPEVELYGFYEGNSLVGTGAIEHLQDCLLLRSVSVQSDKQGIGLGKQIVEYLEALATELGMKDLYLLTEIPGYFQKLNYEAIERQNALDSIKNTNEFSILCPDSAILMKKNW